MSRTLFLILSFGGFGLITYAVASIVTFCDRRIERLQVEQAMRHKVSPVYWCWL